MSYRRILRLLGKNAIFLGLSMLPSLIWGFQIFGGIWENERSGVFALFVSAILSCIFGGALLLIAKPRREDEDPTRSLSLREALTFVPISWICVIFFAALPYLISGIETSPGIPMGFTDAIFESASGITTTGATVLSDVENREMVPRTILFWRSTTHFLGGLGIMLLFISLTGQGASAKTILNFELAKTSPLPQRRVEKATRALMLIYAGLALLLTIILTLLNVPLFDAICHAFATVSTGGFSTYNASIGHFAAVPEVSLTAVEMVLSVFMMISGMNFVLLYFLIFNRSFKFFYDTENRCYLAVIAIATGLIFISGTIQHGFDSYGLASVPLVSGEENRLGHLLALRESFFHTVSILTGTGFCTDRFECWRGGALIIFLALMFIGGCSGSTAGGIKVFRMIISLRACRKKLIQAYRPNIIQPIELNGEPIDNAQIASVQNYIILFLISVFFVALLVLLFEPSTPWIEAGVGEQNRMSDAISASFAMHSDVGPGFGMFGSEQNYKFLSPFIKLVFSWAMLLGRLEIYMLLLIFTPSFWRVN